MKKSFEQYQYDLERFKKLPYEIQRKNSHFSDYYILHAFFQILKFVDTVILTEKMKNEIFVKTHLDFFEREHRDEAGNTTKGIKTFWQLDKFVEHFNKELEDLREKMFLLKASEYNKMDIDSKKAVVNKDFYAFRKFNLIAGGNSFTKKVAELANIELEYLNNLDEPSFVLKGLDCNLSPDTVRMIYHFMTNHNYIQGDSKDFEAIFSNSSNSVQNPVKWLIKHGTKPNKAALYTFLEMMLGNVSNMALKKARFLFVDENSNEFDKKIGRPDKNKKTTYEFEKPLNKILEFSDQSPLPS